MYVEFHSEICKLVPIILTRPIHKEKSMSLSLLDRRTINKLMNTQSLKIYLYSSIQTTYHLFKEFTTTIATLLHLFTSFDVVSGFSLVAIASTCLFVTILLAEFLLLLFFCRSFSKACYCNPCVVQHEVYQLTSLAHSRYYGSPGDSWDDEKSTSATRS